MGGMTQLFYSTNLVIRMARRVPVGVFLILSAPQSVIGKIKPPKPGILGFEAIGVIVQIFRLPSVGTEHPGPVAQRIVLVFEGKTLGAVYPDNPAVLVVGKIIGNVRVGSGCQAADRIVAVRIP
jgi:hypothetical protein